MEQSTTPPAETPPTGDRHEMNAADAAAVAQAGAQAAANAPQGTDQATMKRLIREAIKEEADERGVADAERIATASAAATIAQLEAHGAFEKPADPTPVTPDPTAGATPPPATPAPAVPDEQPRKKTFAERMLRGG